MTQQITELPTLWKEAEGHLRAFEQLARRTVEEAWLAGDSLLRIKQQLPHGAWRRRPWKSGAYIHARHAGSSSFGKNTRKSDKLSVLTAYPLL